MIEINKVQTFLLTQKLHEAGLIAIYRHRQHYRHVFGGIFPCTDSQYLYMRRTFGTLVNHQFCAFQFEALFSVLENVLGSGYMKCVCFSRSGRSCYLDLSLL